MQSCVTVIAIYTVKLQYIWRCQTIVSATTSAHTITLKA